MTYSVFLTHDAEQDLTDLYRFVLQNDGIEKADHVLDQIGLAINRLENMPDRGVYPKELLALGIREYREVFFKPYRIIYRIYDKNVFVMLIVDGRRDMQTLLGRRLLQG